MPDDAQIEVVLDSQESLRSPVLSRILTNSLEEEERASETMEVSVDEGPSEPSEGLNGKKKIMSGLKSRSNLSMILVLIIAVGLISTWFYVTDPDRIDNGNGNGNGITLVANFTWSDADGDGVIAAKENVTFDARSSSPAFVTFSWDFDDGTTDNSNKSVLTHSFDSSGYYWVEVTIRHANKTKTHEEQVVVANEKPPQVDMTLMAGQGNTNTLCRGVFTVLNSTSRDQLLLGNFEIIIYNQTDTYTEKFNGTLAELMPPHRSDSGTPNPLDDYYNDGVNFTDTPETGYLTSGTDALLIAGDGGFQIASGDRITLYYKPVGAMLDDEMIP